MPQLDPWIDRLIASVRQHVVPVLFGERPHPRRSTHLNLVSGIVVDLGEDPFLVTAGHVMNKARERESEPRFHFLVSPRELPLGERMISYRDAIDVATLRLTRAEVAAIEQEGYRMVQPPSWPPPDVTPDASIVAAGFPGKGRSSLSWQRLDLAVETVRAFVRSAGEDQFTTHLDPEYTLLRMVDVTAAESSPSFEGFSGGPAFVVAPEGLLVVPHLCGIVTEGGISNLAAGGSYSTMPASIGSNGMEQWDKNKPNGEEAMSPDVSSDDIPQSILEEVLLGIQAFFVPLLVISPKDRKHPVSPVGSRTLVELARRHYILTADHVWRETEGWEQIGLSLAEGTPLAIPRDRIAPKRLGASTYASGQHVGQRAGRSSRRLVREVTSGAVPAPEENTSTSMRSQPGVAPVSSNTSGVDWSGQFTFSKSARTHVRSKCAPVGA